MAVLSWDKPLERLFEAGVDHGVLYPLIGWGVPWNGLTSINETVKGGEITGHYQDGIRQFQRAKATEYGVTLSAFMYPDEFMVSDGIYSNDRGLLIDSQTRQEFGLSYRTRVGTSIRGTEHGYKLHMIYNAMAMPSSRSYTSLGNTSSATSFAWDIHTRPLAIAGMRSSAHLVVDSTKAPADVMVPLEGLLYGTSTTSPRLPTPSEILALFEAAPSPTLTVSNDANGQFTVSGSDNTVKMIDDYTFSINSPSVVFHDDGTYSVSDY